MTTNATAGPGESRAGRAPRTVSHLELIVNQTDPTAAFTVTAQTISALVSGQPDLKNKFGPGHIRPDGVRLSYRGQHIDARVDGRWVRETGELTTERLDQHYTVREADDILEWPDWLCALATLLRPAAASAVVSPPTDRAALRDRIVAAIKASPFQELRTTDYANGPLQITVKVDDLADTLLRRLAVEAQPCRWEHPHPGYQCEPRTVVEAHDTGTQHREDRAAIERAFAERLAAELKGCCSECDACIEIAQHMAGAEQPAAETPKLPPMDPVHILGIDTHEPAPVAQQPAAEEA